MGDHRRGLELIDQAFRIDPRLPPAMQAVPFVVQCIAGLVEEARASLLRIQSPYAYLHAMMAVCFAACGRDGEARQQLQEFRTRRSPTFDVAGFTRMLMGWSRLPEDQARMQDGARKLGLMI